MSASLLIAIQQRLPKLWLNRGKSIASEFDVYIRQPQSVVRSSIQPSSSGRTKSCSPLAIDRRIRDYANDSELRIAIGQKLLNLVADGVPILVDFDTSP